MHNTRWALGAGETTQVARVATHALTRRARAQIPGVPVMYLQAHRYTIERLPEATLGGAPRT